MGSSNRLPRVLIVDDNPDLLNFLGRLMSESDFIVVTAENARHARKAIANAKPDAALLDYMLPDGNGVELGAQLRRRVPNLPVIIMSGSVLPPEEEAICEEYGFPVLRKPFLATEVMNQFRAELRIRGKLGGSMTRRTAKSRSNDPGNVRPALKVFFCYSHRDERLRDKLDAHLSTLRHMGIIHSWHDRKISAGAEWDSTIDKYLTSADLVLLLISPDFLNSDYCYRKEMKRALERHDKGEARVIPVILRPVDWEGAPFSKLQAAPRDGKPITRWANRDEGYLDATKSIRKAAEELSATVRQVSEGK